MKMFHFVDAAGTDEHYVPVSEIKTIKVGDNTSVIIYIVSFDPAVAAYGNVDLTCTADKADEVASRIAQIIAQGDHDVTKVIAGGVGFEDVSAVAWSDGA
jgi:hypothetical protein